jgi:DNA modification methylase
MTGNLDIRIGDCRELLKELPYASVQCCVTSPPYFGLRDYGVDGQIGLEGTPSAYVENLVEVFGEVRRVLRDDGTLWLNLGDSYAVTHHGKGGESKSEVFNDPGNAWRENVVNKRNKRGIPDGLKPKDLIGIPWMVSFALRDAGWYLRSDIIWHKCLSGGTRVYAKTQKGEMPTTIKDLVRLDPATVKLWNGNRFTQAVSWSETNRNGDEVELVLRSGERIGCTGSHVWPTNRGNVRTDALVVGDVLQTCRLPEPDRPRRPSSIPDDIGWFIGLYIAEGSKSDGTIQIASHVKQTNRFHRLKAIAKMFDGHCFVANTGGKAATCNINSPILAGILDAYVSGRTAKDKHLDVRCWKRADDFLRAVLDGYLSGDGHHAGDRWRLGFCANDNLAADLRTICARLGLSLRLKRTFHTCTNAKGGPRRFPGWRGEIRDTHRDSGGEIVAIEKSRARKFWDIAVEDDPHLFALASGVLTHNSNPMPESVKDRPTRSHEYIFLLTKRERYFYDHEAIKEPPSPDLLKQIAEGYNGTATKDFAAGLAQDASATKTRIINGYRKRVDKQRGHSRRHDGFNDRWDNLSKEEQMACGSNKRSVWSVAPTNYLGAHFATFPPALIKPCILAGTKPGDVVLDPFGGSGTTGMVALELGRKAILIELNPEYQKLIEARTNITPGLPIA